MPFGPIVVRYDDRVLAPRPWTLLQSEWAAELARDAAPGPILELCAGAGHIGLAAAVLSGRDLVQVEQSEVAATHAARNADAAGYAGRVQVRTGPMQHALSDGEEFPVVVADPPYLPTHQVGDWPRDPVLAIDGGVDGLDLVRVCLRVAADHLCDGGHLVLQVAGPEQAGQIRRELPPGLVFRDLRVIDNRRAIMWLQRARRV